MIPPCCILLCGCYQLSSVSSFFFFNDTATTEIYTFPYTTLFRSPRGSPSLLIAASLASYVAAACRRLIPSLVALKDRKSTRLNSSHQIISYAVFCLKKKKRRTLTTTCTAMRHTTAAPHATPTRLL